MAEVFHLDLTRSMLDGAEIAVVPGDPARVERIASVMDDAVFLAANREYTSFRATVDGAPVIVCSTGIGGPSTSIAVEELGQLGVREFLRIGTTGAIQDHVAVGDLIITSGSVRLDGASTHFAPIEFPAVSSFEWTRALVEAAEAEGIGFHVGVTASADTFYPGQERYDTVSGWVTPRFRGSMAEWQRLGVLNYEMESSTLFTQCHALGFRAGCIAGAIVNRTSQEIPDEDLIASTEAATVRVGIEALRRRVARH